MNQRSAWGENVFRPLAVGVMVGCIALSLADLVNLFFPALNRILLVGGCVLAAMEAHYSYRLIRSREMRGSDVMRFRVIEVAMIFILLKIGGYVGDRWIDIMADIRAWPYAPLSIFLDPETSVAFLLAFFSWLASIQTTKDLEQIGEPPEHTPLYVFPQERLANRFFVGGVVLLIIAGIARLGIATLLDTSHPSVPGMVLNVLLYFLLGLTMLGQSHFTRLYRLWQGQKVQVAEDLASHWIRYSLIFIGLAALIAFLLPTSYTFSLLEVASTLIYILGYIVTMIGMFLSFLIGLFFLPFAWLFGDESSPETMPQLPQLSPEIVPPATGSVAPNWWEILRSLVFWVAALGMVIYVIRSYLHDRPELLTALTAFKPVRLLRDFLTALWRRLTGLMEAVSARLPRRLRRQVRPESPESPFNLFRLGAMSPRERILYYYLSILRRADRVGLSRRRAQTPNEYDAVLGPHLDQAQREMTQLTQAFVEARYSRRTFDHEQDRRIRTRWQQVKSALRALVRRNRKKHDN
ncbi:MAG: DUF4129 domain-containing protein [Chloroflexi bacterium]|nr:DUF4129 domain-containing protein [Chloroflexota bacterium]